MGEGADGGESAEEALASEVQGAGETVGRSPTVRSPQRAALIVLAAGLAVRGIWSFLLVPWWEGLANVGATPDGYPVLARSLLERGTLGFGAVGADPTTARGPAFACWLAAGQAIGGDGLGWLGFWGGLPGVLAAASLAWVAAGRWGLAVGLATGVIAACHPLPALSAGRLMGDDFYAALGWGGVAAWTRAMSAASPEVARSPAALAAMMLGGQMLARGSGVTTLAALAGVTLLARPAVWRRVAIVAAIALAGPLVWSVRSTSLEGRPVFVDSMIWYNFWMGESFHRFGPETVRGEHAGARRQLIAEAAGMPSMARPDFWWGQLAPRENARSEERLRASALQLIGADPLGYARRCLAGLWRFWCGAQTARRVWHYAAAVAPILILAAAGSVPLLRHRPPADLLGAACLAVLLLHWLSFAAIVPMARYSVRVYPEVAWLAGAGSAWLLKGGGVRR